MATALEAAGRRQQDEHDRATVLAWSIEALHRHKTLPKLKTLIGRRAQAPPSIDGQRAILEILSAQYGIPLRKAKAS